VNARSHWHGFRKSKLTEEVIEAAPQAGKGLASPNAHEEAEGDQRKDAEKQARTDVQFTVHRA